MDPIAHTLFGAALAEAGLKRKTAFATATLIIGANIPDVDALAMLVSSDFALLARRGWTHGILALMLWPFLLTGVMMAIDRFRRRKKPDRTDSPVLHAGWLLGIAFIGVWSHPLLDWMNTYGVRVLMPFSDTWFYGDTLFIIDPWFWLLAGSGVVLARSESWKSITGWIVLGLALTALVTTADIVPLVAKILWGAGIVLIAILRWSGRNRATAQPIALGLVCALVLYTAFMYFGARTAESHARQHLAKQGITVEAVMANPLPARTLLRSGIASSDDYYYLFIVNWTQPESFQLTMDPIPITSPDNIVEAALASPDVRGLRNWIRFPLYEVREKDTGWRVFIRDLRYVHPAEDAAVGIGLSIVDLDEDLNVLEVRQ